jgi:hypothetical protein
VTPEPAVPEYAKQRYPHLAPMVWNAPRGAEVEIGDLATLTGLEDGWPVVKSFWKPSEEELGLLNQGAYIEVEVLAPRPPPIALNILRHSQ